MADLYAVDLALNLGASVPKAVLADLRWHLGMSDGGAEDGAGGDEEVPGDALDDRFPLLAGRGPAARVGGVLVGELAPTAGGWCLTARQEVHAELLPELDSLAERLVWNSVTEGVVGQVRFYEDHVPELWVNKSGTLVKISLVATATASPPPGQSADSDSAAP
ncbi:hypothetical protein [Streptomyces sp. NBC_01320]|uniref:hypothetical protein n=1 Tax=Streptomyces sp. NBC_01320 TaxID=2903824 RepID=UPI002E15E172|nr:hypothetical protein OG395_10270 [Streptomyces sp. NBC_01320]